jgi:hypothetical protein
MYGPSKDGQTYGTGLPQGTVGRIKELKGLMNKFPQYDRIIRLAIFNSINGDNNLLDQMLDVAATILTNKFCIIFICLFLILKNNGSWLRITSLHLFCTR